MDAERHRKEMEDLFREWKGSWQGRSPQDMFPAEKFVQDGPIYPSAYWQGQRRMVFVLKDTNNLGNCDLAAAIRADLKRGKKTWPWVTRWAGALLGEDPGNSEKIWANVAMLNLKKADGGSSLGGNVLNWYALMDKKHILDEFEILDPQVVFLCGTADSALWLFNLDKMPIGREKPFWFAQDGRIFISIWHPKYRRQQRLEEAQDWLRSNREKIWANG